MNEQQRLNQTRSRNRALRSVLRSLSLVQSFYEATYYLNALTVPSWAILHGASRLVFTRLTGMALRSGFKVCSRLGKPTQTADWRTNPARLV
jgi:hypothetical protein